MKPVNFYDCKKLLAQNGYLPKQKNGGGSHVVFCKPGNPTVIVPFHKDKPVSAGVMRQVYKAIQAK